MADQPQSQDGAEGVSAGEAWAASANATRDRIYAMIARSAMARFQPGDQVATEPSSEEPPPADPSLSSSSSSSSSSLGHIPLKAKNGSSRSHGGDYYDDDEYSEYNEYFARMPVMPSAEDFKRFQRSLDEQERLGRDVTGVDASSLVNLTELYLFRTSVSGNKEDLKKSIPGLK